MTCSIFATSSDSIKDLERVAVLFGPGGGNPAGPGVCCRHGGGVADLTSEVIITLFKCSLTLNIKKNCFYSIQLILFPTTFFYKCGNGGIVTMWLGNK